MGIKKTLTTLVLIGAMAFGGLCGKPKTSKAGEIFTYTADTLPTADGWNIRNYEDYESIAASVSGGVLNLDDNHTYSGSGVGYYRELPQQGYSDSPLYQNIIEFDAKFTQSTGFGATTMTLDDRGHHMHFDMYPNEIIPYYGAPGIVKLSSLTFDNSSQFNTYKMFIDKTGMANLHINGTEILKTGAAAGTYGSVPENIGFGLTASSKMGEMQVDEIRGYSILEDLSKPSFFEGTKNYYKPVIDSSLTWDQAKQAAENSTYLGFPGYLATITSSEESNFVSNLMNGILGEVFIGGYQPAGSPEPAGGWQWVTGEPWSYTAWRGAEPNNSSGRENVIKMFQDGGWNDWWGDGKGVDGYIIEYEIPDPLTEGLLLLGGAALLGKRKRKR